jgi:hypothetical protein
MGSRSRETHCWEVSQCENTQQRGLSTRAVTNNYQFPVSESADVCEGTPSHVAVQQECKTDTESPQGNRNPAGLHVPLAELKNIPIVPGSVAKSPQFQRESISQRNVTLLSTYLRITFCACCWEAMVGDRVV